MLFFRVMMHSMAKAIIALALFVILTINKTESKCCDIAYRSSHVCLGLPTEKDIRNHWIWDFPIDVEQEYWMRNEADIKRPKCVSYFCEDGTDATKNTCGKGKCNIFGCNCKGGCRKGDGSSHQEMGRRWRGEHGLLEKGRHKLKGRFQ